MELLKFATYVIVTLCIVNILDKLADVCNAKIDEIQQKTKLVEYDNLNLLIDQAQTIVTTVVQSVNQTYVDALKKAGKFTEEAAMEAKETAFGLAREMMTKEIVMAIRELYGDLDIYLNTLIEKTVKDLKN